MSNNKQGAKLRATAAEIVDDVVNGGRSLDVALPAVPLFWTLGDFVTPFACFFSCCAQLVGRNGIPS